MDLLRTFIAEHLDVSEDDAAGNVAHMASMATRYVMFRIGHVRLALRSADVAAVTAAPDRACEYLDASIVVPARYRALARIDATHRSYLHVAGTRFGLGPCRADGDVVLLGDAINRHTELVAEDWIAGTIDDPPSLVLDRAALAAYLHATTLDRSVPE